MNRCSFIVFALLVANCCDLIAAMPAIRVRNQVQQKSKPQVQSSYTYYATHFGGASYITNATCFAADGTSGTVSFWFNMTGNDTANHILFNNSGGFFGVARLNTAGGAKWRVQGLIAAGSEIKLDIRSNDAFTTSSNPGWHHFIASWRLDATPVAYIYIDGSANLAASPTIADSGTGLDYKRTTTSVSLGVLNADHTTGPIHMDISEFWFDVNFIDITDPTKLTKFISGGKPVSLGSTGQTPLGTQPLLYFNNPYGTFQVNKGSAGSFTAAGDALTAAATTP